MPTDLKRFREDAVKKAMADLPEGHDPSFAGEGERAGNVAGAPEVQSAFAPHLQQTEAEQVGRALDESRKTKESSEEKPKAPEPEGGRYDLQNRMAPSTIRAGMEMHGLAPDYLKRLRESASQKHWTDPLAEGEEETGGDTGADWTHEGSRSRMDELAATEGWDSASRDALHGLYDKASTVYGENPLDIVDFSPETVEADGMTLPREIVFSDADGNKLSVDWPSGAIMLFPNVVDE